MFGERYSKRELRCRERIITGNINKVYKCTNEECETKYVRMYQLLEHLKKGVSMGYGKEKYFITHKIEDYIIEEWCETHNYGNIELKKIQENYMICPSCNKTSLIEGENYSWLETVQDPPFITLKEWNIRREKITNAIDEFRRNLDSIEKLLRSNKEIKEFQNHHSLNSFRSTRELNALSKIKQQLKEIVDKCPYMVIKNRAFLLLEDLNTNK